LTILITVTLVTLRKIWWHNFAQMFACPFS